LLRMKRLAAVTLASALILGTAAFPALAINDSRVPADECSGNLNAVGEPAADVFRNTEDQNPVGLPTSANNPGASIGAQGQEESQATENCN
jgi:hypothetical protein